MNFRIDYDKPKIVNDNKTMPPNVIIDGNRWSLCNLNTPRFNDGSEIPLVTDPEEWAKLTTPAYCYYNEDVRKGVLYNWYAVATGKLAPIGWHVATDEEWATIDTLDKIAKLELKKQLSGYRYRDGNFYSQSFNGYWWSATEDGETTPYYRCYLSYDHETLFRDFNGKKFGFSVRIVKDKT